MQCLPWGTSYPGPCADWSGPHTERKAQAICSCLTSIHLQSITLSCPLQKLSPQMQTSGLTSEVLTSSLALRELCGEKSRHSWKDACQKKNTFLYKQVLKPASPSHCSMHISHQHVRTLRLRQNRVENFVSMVLQQCALAMVPQQCALAMARGRILS